MSELNYLCADFWTLQSECQVLVQYKPLGFN